MAATRDGSQQAFVTLIERWEGDLLRYFRLSGADSHAAEDGVQETFLRVFAYRHRYAPTPLRSFAVFLYRIARNVRVDALRRKMRSPSCVPLHAEEGNACVSGEAAGLREESLDLEAALGSLPEKLRSVVILTVFQGLIHRDVAALLGIPVGTVKSRMHLALVRLREVMHADSP